MIKVFDFRANAYVYVDAPEDDALFAPRTTPLFREPSRITCRVCERGSLASDHAPLLCADCARDPAAMERHIAGVMAGQRSATERALEALTAALPDEHDTALSGRWGNYQSAMGTDSARAAEDAARRGVAGPLADLIRLWLAYQSTLTQYNNRAEWAHRARLALPEED